MRRVPGLTSEQAIRAAWTASPLAIPQTLNPMRTAASSIVQAVSLPVNSTTAHTPGAWTELIASTSAEAWGVVLRTPSYAATGVAREALIDIAIGAASSEVAIITDVDFGFQSATGNSRTIIPVLIPVGSRVSGRLRQSSTTGASFSLTCDLISAAWTGPNGRPRGNPISIGANTAASRGTTLTAPGSLNTKAAWTELTSATTQPFSALLLNVSSPQGSNITAADMLVDVGVGASGSETVVLSDYPVTTGSAETILRYGGHWPVPGPFPAGTRIVARYQRSATATLTAHVHGIP